MNRGKSSAPRVGVGVRKGKKKLYAFFKFPSLLKLKLRLNLISLANLFDFSPISGIMVTA